MNERIRELAEQAVQLVADECTKGDVSRLNTDSYHVKGLVNQKFAELLIAECVDIVEKVPPGYKDYRNQIEDSFREYCIASIKHRFGVE